MHPDIGIHCQIASCWNTFSLCSDSRNQPKGLSVLLVPLLFVQRDVFSRLFIFLILFCFYRPIYSQPNMAPPGHSSSPPFVLPTPHMCISGLHSPRHFPAPMPLYPPPRDIVVPPIQEWLKKQRLHKYAYLFEGMTVQQVSPLLAWAGIFNAFISIHPYRKSPPHVKQWNSPCSGTVLECEN